MHQMACPMDWGTSNVTTGRDLNPKNFTVDCFAFQLNEIPIHKFEFVVLEIVQGIDEALMVPVVAFAIGSLSGGEGFWRRQMSEFRHLQLLKCGPMVTHRDVETLQQLLV